MLIALIFFIGIGKIACSLCPQLTELNKTEEIWFGKFHVILDKPGLEIDLSFDAKSFALGVSRAYINLKRFVIFVAKIFFRITSGMCRLETT